MKGKLLYRTAGHNGGLVFAREDRARRVARIHEAIRTSKTWADFRRAMPRQDYSKILRAFDIEGEPRPRGTDDFSGDMLPGWSEGDYPPWLQPEMSQLIPEHILERFGTRTSTPLNGSYWSIPPEAAESMCAALSSMGGTIEHAPDMPFW